MNRGETKEEEQQREMKDLAQTMSAFANCEKVEEAQFFRPLKKESINEEEELQLFFKLLEKFKVCETLSLFSSIISLQVTSWFSS